MFTALNQPVPAEAQGGRGGRNAGGAGGFGGGGRNAAASPSRRRRRQLAFVNSKRGEGRSRSADGQAEDVGGTPSAPSLEARGGGATGGARGSGQRSFGEGRGGGFGGGGTTVAIARRGCSSAESHVA